MYLAFVALAAEVQTYLQLDEVEKAARTLAQGLDELLPGLTQLMNAVLDCTSYYLKPEFAGQVDLGLMLWLHNGFRRMKCKPGESAEQLSASELIEIMRPHITKVFKSQEHWHGRIPQAIVYTSAVPDAWIRPINQGTDKGKHFKLVNKQLAAGLNRIATLIETHDLLLAEVLQREEMKRLGLKPTELRQQLLLPEGQAAAVVLDARWIAQSLFPHTHSTPTNKPRSNQQRVPLRRPPLSPAPGDVRFAGRQDYGARPGPWPLIFQREAGARAACALRHNRRPWRQYLAVHW